jgi:phospholipid/cholesterol/gamma-HCH transport system ATP-binding protein
MESNESKPSVPIVLMEGIAAGSLLDPSATVLVDVNWKVNPGDFWVLAGLQGSGKSDFLMLTAGLMAPLRGQYWLFAQEMPIFEEERLAERLRLGLVFENGQLFNHLTVSENLALPLRYHRNLTRAEAESAVQSMLEVMELAPWADSMPGALGKNWHKRIGLARALMLKPEILLIDNPLAGLDLRHTYWWLGVLERLSKSQNFVRDDPVTLAVTTADLRPWIGLARQFAILKNQRMTVLGNRAQVEAASQEVVGELLTLEAPHG